MAKAELLVDGLYFGEGPRWHEGKLWLSDFYAHAVKTVTLGGDVEAVAHVDNQPSGLGWLPDGRLLVVSMLDRKVLRQEADGTLVEHADLSSIATFHCNDMVVDALGRAYVGNFGFDLDAMLHDVGVEGVLADPPLADLARVDPDGSVHLAAHGLAFPNGAVITPDGRTLIIAETVATRLTAFTIGDDGSLSDRRTWADLGGHAPDGICLDAEGNIWVSNPLEPKCMLVAEEGFVLDVIETDQPCYACMLGGPERRHLFMLTAHSSNAVAAAAQPTGHVLVAEVAVPGAGLP